MQTASTDGLAVLPFLCLPGLVATDSESQFSSRGSMRLSDSGSAEDVEEYEIQGERGTAASASRVEPGFSWA